MDRHYLPLAVKLVRFYFIAAAFAILNMLVWKILLTLTFSSLKINADDFANSADPDDTAQHKPSHQDLHCLPFCF